MAILETFWGGLERRVLKDLLFKKGCESPLMLKLVAADEVLPIFF